MSTLLAVDGDNIAMTALHLVHARNDAHDPTARLGATLDRFVAMLAARVRLYAPERVVVCWDDPKGSWRHRRWEGYKAGRTKTLDPDGRNTGYELIRHFLRLTGIRQVQADGYEADDLVAAFWRGAREPVTRVMIFSGDNDYAQLLGTNASGTRQVETVQVKPDDMNRLYGAGDVVARYGVHSFDMALYKAIVGDSSDGIPGAKGIGKVGAVKRISEGEDHVVIIDALPEAVRDDVRLFLELIDLRNVGEHGLMLGPPAPFRPFDRTHPRTGATAELLEAYACERLRTDLLAGELWTPRQDAYAAVSFRGLEGADQR